MVDTIDILTILLSGLILFIAYFIRGISGFGSGLVAIPLLAHLLPLQFVVPWVLLLDFTASLALGGRRQDRRAINWREISWLMPTTLLGILIGAALLVNLPKSPLLIGLGIFVGVFGLRSLLFVHGDRKVSLWWSLPTGLLGGIVGAMFGTGGPPYVIYLSRRIQNKR
ncbi:MAG: sulfite exporter TauE/SafE family protein, partial [Chromatiales bacterium]